MKQPKEKLKSYFETGDKPTENQFCDLIDSFFHLDSGVIITNITEDDGVGVTISFSDGTSIDIENPGSGDNQNNIIRSIDLGDVDVFNGSSELNINQAVADRFNVLPDNIRRITETENIVIKANINFSFEE